MSENTQNVFRIGERIRDLRIEYGYTQEKLAELSGVDYKHIQLLEGLKPSSPRMETLGKISQAFGLTLSEFFVDLSAVSNRSKQGARMRFSDRLVLEAIMRVSSDGILVTDSSQTILRINETLSGLFGMRSSELIGQDLKNILRTFRQETVDAWLEYEAKIRSCENNSEFVIPVRTERGIIQLSVRAGLLDREAAQSEAILISNWRDITDQKLAEDALIESETKYKSLFSQARDYLFVLEMKEDGPPLIADVNDYALDILGYTREELIGNPITMIDDAETGSLAPERSRQALIDGRFAFEVTHVRKDGSKFIADVSGSLIEFGDRHFFFSIERDITERKRIEEDSASKHSLNQILLDQFPCAAYLINPRNREILACNEQAKNEGGRNGDTCFASWSKRSQPCEWCRLPMVLETGKAQSVEYEKNGRVFDAHWIPVSDEMTMHYIFDITEKRKFQNKVFESQKMVSIRNLAGGVAHDFNNSLAGIMGYASMLEKLILDRQHLQFIQGILKSSERAADQIGKLLLFGKRGISTKNTVDLNKVVEGIVEILERTIDRRIDLRFFPESHLLSLRIDLSHIKQVVMNLCVNASEAIADSGSITIRTGNVWPDESFLKNHPELESGAYVLLEITDSRTGIDANARLKVFEPFYSTKADGDVTGAGLGLSVVYSVVTGNGGAIDVDSEVGKGTTIKVYFRAPDQSAPIAGSKSMKNPINSVRILIVEDEPIIRNMLKDMLVSLEYSVLIAEDGLEGVEIFRREHTRIDAVLLDLMMPRMNGYDAFKEMKNIDPSARIIISTGFTSGNEAQELMALGAKEICKKPFTVEKLSGILSSVLG